MKFQLAQYGWRIADRLIPIGTIIDDQSDDDWSKLARGHSPPPNATALDQEAADLMLRMYPGERIFTGPNVRGGHKWQRV